LTELQTQLEGKSVEIDIDDRAKELLAKNGYDKRIGARPMSRLIQQQIKKPLAEELLFGRLKEGGSVTITVDEKANKLRFVFEEEFSTKSRKRVHG